MDNGLDTGKMTDVINEMRDLDPSLPSIEDIKKEI